MLKLSALRASWGAFLLGKRVVPVRAEQSGRDLQTNEASASEKGAHCFSRKSGKQVTSSSQGAA